MSRPAGGQSFDIIDRLRVRAELLENMAEGVGPVSPRGEIVYTNPAYDEMHGYARGELIGKTLVAVCPRPPEELARMVGSLIEELKKSRSWSGEFHCKRKDGSQFTGRALSQHA